MSSSTYIRADGFSRGGASGRIIIQILLILAARFIFQFSAHAEASGSTNQAGLVLTVEGTVQIARSGEKEWSVGGTNMVLNFGDSLRTGARSRATVRLSDLSVIRVNEQTLLQIRSQRQGGGSLLDLRSGSSYFFNRSKPSSLRFETPLISGAIRGTEFNLAAEKDGRTTVTLIEGEVALNNAKGDLVLQSGEQGVVEPGEAPRKTAVLNAINIIQWSLYYPAVLDSDELGLSEGEKRAIADSLAAYRAGDLLAALAKYPADREPASDAERLQYAGLLLAVGQVEQTEAELKKLQAPSRFSQALQKLIASVKHVEFATNASPTTASEWLAESYYLQSQSKLDAARQAALNAANKSPLFGFAWVRVAELEFSLGHTREARRSLERGLEISPRNAQALALKGFILASENRINEAKVFFDRAIAVDGALGNAWLGRGLCKIRQGDDEAGRQDLQVAATLEPNRSELRSYLGKAWAQTGDQKHAMRELDMARQLDPADPTPWLYSALLKYQYNNDNQAVDDLERSKELNNNRSVYRSRFLLDQDQAVRSANLAQIYQDVGMVDVSVREAARAVDLDYANYSAHLFLANSYDALRDPNQVNLRYETPWFSELLVANLLAPAGAVPLSQSIAQQEYSPLFAKNRVGIYSATEYLSRGAWVQSASEYGTFGNTDFAFDQFYRTDNGQRANNEVEDLSLSFRLKQQITPHDSVFFEVNHNNFSSGDVLQYHDQNAASRSLKITDKQNPNLFLGYHHEWSPGIHTLFLAGRLQDEFTLTDTNTTAFVTTKNPGGQITAVSKVPARLDFSSELTAYTAELQQIFQSENQSLVLGARYQAGEIDTYSFVERTFIFNPTPFDQTTSPDLNRFSTYGYYNYQVVEPLLLIAGIAYDHLEFPENNELAPVSSAETSKDRVSPKAGFRWMPLKDTTFRGAWTRSLGGVFYDTSVRLEPTQIAGFNQAFRSLIPESIAGLVPGSEFETFGLAFDQKFPTRTYFSVVGELFKSSGSRTVGTIDALGPFNNVASGVRQNLDFEEKSVSLIVNQLLGDQFAVGASYRISKASLDDEIPAISPALSAAFSPSANRNVSATLQQANLYALFNHQSGFFSKLETVWYQQSNSGYAVSLAGDDFWQVNAFAGYRMLRRRVEMQVGVLNIGDQNYQLNPLNLYTELPRSRTFVATFRFNF